MRHHLSFFPPRVRCADLGGPNPPPPSPYLPLVPGRACWHAARRARQDCGKGLNGSFHAADGAPLWAKETFPDPAGMVAKAHSLGLKAGWYMNNCDCHERGLDAAFAERIYRSSVKMLAEQKWDGVKLDGCSQFHNTTFWAALMEETGGCIFQIRRSSRSPAHRFWSRRTQYR